MKSLRTILQNAQSIYRAWFRKVSPDAFLLLASAFYVALFVILLLVAGGPSLSNLSYVSSASSPPSSTPGRPVTDPAEIAALDEEFGDLTCLGYSADIVYHRGDLLSDQLEAGCGPLHNARGYRLLVGKTGSVIEVTYGKPNGESGLTAEPEPGVSLYLLLLDGYTAPEEWWNRPVASAWCEDGTVVGQTFPELSMWSPWPEAADSGLSNGEKRSACGWYWDGTAYAEFDRYTTLVVNDGHVDFAVLSQPSSP